jgi:hypothetical protein
MKTACVVAWLFVALTIDVAHADSASATISSQGVTSVAAVAGKVSIRVRIKTHEVQIGKPSDGRPAIIESSCTYSRYPCSVVDGLEIVVNERRLFVPRSVFADLADLNKAEVTAAEKGLTLKLYGGDASEGFILTVEFDSNRIKRRILSSGMAPDRMLQETKYFVVEFGG